MISAQEPAVWLPPLRAGSGVDGFTIRLANGFKKRGNRAEIRLNRDPCGTGEYEWSKGIPPPRPSWTRWFTGMTTHPADETGCATNDASRQCADRRFDWTISGC